MAIPQMAALAGDHWKKVNPKVYQRMVKDKALVKDPASDGLQSIRCLPVFRRGAPCLETEKRKGLSSQKSLRPS